MGFTGAAGATGIQGFHARLVGAAVISFFALVTLAATGCSGPGAGLGEGVLAVVNGDPITVEDYRAANKGAVPATLEERRGALGSIIDNKLVSKAALADGMMTDSEVLAGVQQFYSERLPDYLRKKIAGETDVTEEELLPFKTELKPSFNVSMIVTKTLEDAETALGELEGGADFQEVAGRLSTLKDSERRVGMSDELYPVGVRAVMNRLKPGELSPAMKMGMGYVVVRMNSRLEPEDIWQSQVEGLRNEIKKRKVDQKMADIIDRLRSTAKVKLNRRVDKDGKERLTGAVVNGVTVDLEAQMFESDDSPHAPHQGFNPESMEASVNNMVNRYLLSEEARRLRIQEDPDFQRELRLKEEEVLTDIYLEKVRGEAEATPADIKEYYEENKEKYTIPPRVRLSRILVHSREEALEVVRKLKEGADFAELARKVSEDVSTSKDGGDVGFVVVEKLKEPLKGVISGLEVGEVSGVVDSDYGFEVLKMTGSEPAALTELSKVEDTIARRVILKKKSERVEKFFEELRKKADIKINEKLLESI